MILRRKILSLLLFTLISLSTSKAYAVVIYDFFGACDAGCDYLARGVLTLNDSYTPGNQVARDDYVSWRFYSSAGAYDLNSPSVSGISGFFGMLPKYAGTSNFMIDFGGDNTFFLTGTRDFGEPASEGDWLNTGPEPSACAIYDCENFNFVVAQGLKHAWIRRVEEPTMALMLLAFVGLNFWIRKLRFRQEETA